MMPIVAVQTQYDVTYKPPLSVHRDHVNAGMT